MKTMKSAKIFRLATALCLFACFCLPLVRSDAFDAVERAKVRAFLDSMAENGAKVDGIDLRQSSLGGRGLFAAKSFQKNDVIFSVPEKLWIGKQAVDASAISAEVDDRSWSENLAAVILQEKRNPKSIWSTWFSLLPALDTFQTPLFWSNEELAELQASHTKYFTLQRKRTVETLLRDVFHSNRRTDPKKNDWVKSLTLDEVKWALSIVWSRNFAVAEKESAVVPIADFMNMQQPAAVTHPMVRADVKDGVLSYISNTDIAEGVEILAPYGVIRPIPNGELLTDFGFVWESNFYDGVPFRSETPASDKEREQRNRLRGIWRCHRPVIPLFYGHIPDELMCAARVLTANRQELKQALNDPDSFNGKMLSKRGEKAAFKWIKKEAARMQRSYPTSVEEDTQLLALETNQRIKNAILIRKREKEILKNLIEWSQTERAKLGGLFKTDSDDPKDEL